MTRTNRTLYPDIFVNMVDTVDEGAASHVIKAEEVTSATTSLIVIWHSGCGPSNGFLRTTRATINCNYLFFLKAGKIFTRLNKRVFASPS